MIPPDCPDEADRIQLFGGQQNLVKRFLCLFQKQLLQEQISTCITGKYELRKDQNPAAISGCFPHGGNHLFCIVERIRHADLWCNGRNFYKTMIHRTSSVLSGINDGNQASFRNAI